MRDNPKLMMPSTEVSKKKNKKLLRKQTEEWLKFIPEKLKRLTRQLKTYREQKTLAEPLLKRLRKKKPMLSTRL